MMTFDEMVDAVVKGTEIYREDGTSFKFTRMERRQRAKAFWFYTTDKSIIMVEYGDFISTLSTEKPEPPNVEVAQFLRDGGWEANITRCPEKGVVVAFNVEKTPNLACDLKRAASKFNLSWQTHP